MPPSPSEAERPAGPSGGAPTRPQPKSGRSCRHRDTSAACWPQAAWQPQVGPQAQAVPHWQAELGALAVVWQPQVQDEPGQVTQVQVLVADMMDSSCAGELPC